MRWWMICLLVLGVWGEAHGQSIAGKRPNIVVILTDDQGYGDISAHGNPVLKTPNLDRLRSEGVRFTDFHVSPTCAPTRSALLTGRHEFRNGITHTILERERLTLDAITLPQVLRNAGYRTGIFGKWHLGDEEAYRPNRRGFDEYFIHGAGGIGQTYEGSCGDAPNNKYQNPAILHNGTFEKTQGYCTDVFFQQAISWMDHERKQDRPFFTWIATNAPHAPYNARPEDRDRYASVTPSAEVANFFGMVHNIDENVGKLLDTLREWKIEENTLVVFMNDNGGTAGTKVFNAGMRAAKGTAWLGGTRASSFWRWPKTLTPADCSALSAHIDVFPTLAAIAGASLPEKARQQIEGRSLLPWLESPNSSDSPRTLFTHVGRWPKGTDPNEWKYKMCSIRTQQWHLVSPNGNKTPNWQLFDVSKDYAESNDVASAHQDIVKQLATQFDGWWREVVPMMVNENAVGPAVNSFKELYWKQFGKDEEPPTAKTTPRNNRPNILFCFADDWGRYASAYSAIDPPSSINHVIKTPNIDQVASRGVLFRNAFAPCPSCTPCRSSLLSGQYFWRTGRGSILQGASWDPQIPSFALLLNDSGYQLGKYTKVWSPGTPADAPFGGQKFAFEKAGREYNNYSKVVTKAVGNGVPLNEIHNKLLQEVRDNFQTFLQQRDRNQPFFFWFGPTLVHRTWIQGSGKALWKIDPDSLRGKVPEFLPDNPEIREDIADYLGEVQAWDAGVGVLLECLKASGEFENTVIVLSGDHGMPGMPCGKCNLKDFGVGVSLMVSGPNIPSGRVVDDFANLMDLAPTFLELGGQPIPKVMTSRSLVPVLHTAQQGQIDPTRDYVITGRERHVAMARANGVPYPQRAFRTKDFLYIRNFAPDRWPMGDPKAAADDVLPSHKELTDNTHVAFADMDASPTKAWLIEHRQDPAAKRYHDLAFAKRPAEELYDLRVDPQQVRNIADQASYASDLARMRQRLMSVLEETQDPRAGDGAFFETPPMAGPLANAKQ